MPRTPTNTDGDTSSASHCVDSRDDTPTVDETIVNDHTEGEHLPQPNTSSGDAQDEIVVDWDGPDDPENPKNWSFREKWIVTLVMSSYTFISPISSAMIAPAASQVAAEFGVQSHSIIAMMTSIFVLGYAVGPLFIGPLSEIYGRSRVIQLANLFYLAWNTACGFSQSKSQFIAFRFLSGLGGSAPLAVGGGLLGDVWHPEDRGTAVSIYSLAPLLGPVLGPVCGGWIVERSLWRWVFWSTSIVDVAIQVVGFFTLRETFAPLLLSRKAQKIRASLQNDAEKGPPRNVRTIYDGKTDRSWKSFVARALRRPLTLFLREPILQVLGLYMAFVYGIFYLFLTTMPGIFTVIYQERIGIAGLHYISLGLGLTFAAQTNARAMDRIYIHLKKKHNDVGQPEFRLPCMVPGTILLPIGLLIAGWNAQKHGPWAVTDLGIAFVGAGIIYNFQVMQTYIVDTFTLYAASALAAVSCLRSLAGFGFPLFAPAMFSALGYGRGNTILAAIAIVGGCPAPWVLWFYGERLRGASKYARHSVKN